MNLPSRKKACGRAVLLLLLVVLSGCRARPTLISPLSISPTPIAASPTPSLTPSPSSAPATPTLTMPAPTSTSIPQVSATPSPKEMLSGSWELFSNPNDIRGLALVENQLWAATLGGVLQWDLSTESARLFTTLDGLAEIQGNAVVYCPDGSHQRLYVGHENGWISELDLQTQKWNQLEVARNEGGQNRSIHTLYCDLDGQRLLAGGPGGVSFLDLATRQWMHVGAAEGLKADSIYGFLVNRQTTWVAAGNQGGFVVDGRKVVPFSSLSGFPTGRLQDMEAGTSGGAWLVYEGGLVSFNFTDQSMISYGAQPSSGIPFGGVDRIESSPNGLIWITKADEGACPFDPITRFCSTIYPVPDGFQFSDLVVDEKGVAYAGTNGAGIIMLLPDGIQKLMFDQRILGNDVLDLAEDGLGRMWTVSTGGLSLLRPGDQTDSEIEGEAKLEGLLSQQVSGLYPDGSRLWFSYADQPALSRWEEETWFHLNEQIPWQHLSDMATDGAGYTWFATDQGIFFWDGTLLQPFVPAEDLPVSQYQTLLPDNDILWLGTDRGLWRCFNEECQWVVTGVSVSKILPEQNGGVLLGTSQGLIRYIDGRRSLVVVSLPEKQLLFPVISSLVVDHEQQLWVGTQGEGVLVFNGQQWRQVNTRSGLPTNHVRMLYVDRQGAVWIATATETGGGALVCYIP